MLTIELFGRPIGAKRKTAVSAVINLETTVDYGTLGRNLTSQDLERQTLLEVEQEIRSALSSRFSAANIQITVGSLGEVNE